MVRKKNKQQRKEAALDEWLHGKGGREGIDESAVESQGSSTQKQIDELNKKFDLVLNKLNQLAVAPSDANKESRVPIAARTQVPSNAEDPPQPTMNQLLYILHEDLIQTRYMQASALLKNLSGDEGRTQVESYFRQFENMTYGWSDKRRANLLATHLQGPALNTFESLSDTQQQQYETIKLYISQSNANRNAIRTQAQNEVMRGIRQNPSESLYNLRHTNPTNGSRLSSPRSTRGGYRRYGCQLPTSLFGRSDDLHRFGCTEEQLLLS